MTKIVWKHKELRKRMHGCSVSWQKIRGCEADPPMTCLMQPGLQTCLITAKQLLGFLLPWGKTIALCLSAANSYCVFHLARAPAILIRLLNMLKSWKLLLWTNGKVLKSVWTWQSIRGSNMNAASLLLTAASRCHLGTKKLKHLNVLLYVEEEKINWCFF